MLDYEALDLKPFYAGASVRYAGAFHRVADPLRHLWDGLASLANPIGSPLDKINVGLFRLKALLGDTYGILSRPETTTLQRLQVSVLRQVLRNLGYNADLQGTRCKIYSWRVF